MHAGVACLMYGTMGIFGAARFGQGTEGDCLVNTWLGGRREGWMDLAMALYLSISIPPMQVTTTLALSNFTSSDAQSMNYMMSSALQPKVACPACVHLLLQAQSQRSSASVQQRSRSCTALLMLMYLCPLSEY